MSEQAISRRQAFAEFVVFGDPVEIWNGDSKLGVMLETLDELRRWAARFLPDARAVVCPVKPGEASYLAYADGEWNGWELNLRAKWPVGEEPELDEATAGQLEAIAAGDVDLQVDEEEDQAALARADALVGQALEPPLAALTALNQALTEYVEPGGTPGVEHPA